MGQINRKKFLQEATLSALGTLPAEKVPQDYIDPSNKTLPRSLQKTATGIAPYTGVWGETQIYQLLRRTLFGVKKSDMDFFKTKNLNESVDFLLTVPSGPPPPPLNNYSVGTALPDADVPFGQTWVNAPYNGTIDFARRSSFKSWWLGLMINQDRSLREKMTLFWHNLLATESNSIGDARYSYKHHALLRANCLGNYKSLVKEVTIDPAMLRYLNGFVNTKTAPDENYARELQELFTIGKDLLFHYTEDDVKQAAKVLTGWKDSRTGINSTFDSTRHDTSNKTFSAFYNNTIITGKTGAAGAGELDELLNMIFANEEASKYIVRKLYRFFVYYVIDDIVESQVIVPLAQVFRNNGYNIKPVLETLFKSEHFYDSLNMACVIKPGVDHIVGLARQMNITFPDATNIQQQYAHWQYFGQICVLLGQEIGDPPNVAGWPAYYQEPQYYEMWINSDSLPKRNSMCDSMIYTGYQRFGFTTKINTVAFVEQFTSPQDPNLLINQITKLLYPLDISQTSKDSLKVSFLLSGQTSDYYWTDAWNAYKANPTNTASKTAVETRIQGLLKYLMGQAEFQLS